MGQALEKERPRVLFVDDEKRVLNSMRIMFRREYDLFLASNGTEALKIIRDNDIDVIVADHRMPQMTGVQVLSQARTVSPRTVRILLTGYADLDAVEGSINDGEVFRFLTKPCAPAQLKETVALAARLARETASVEAASVELAASEIDLMLDDARPRVAPGPAGGQPATKRAAARQQSPAPPARPAAQSAAARPPAGRHAPAGTRAPAQHAPPSAPAEPQTPPGATPPTGDAEAFDPASTSVLEKPPMLAEGPRVAPGTPRQVRGLGIIVFSADPEVITAVQQAVRGRVPVYSATNIVKVVKCLTDHQPGVLVTDVSDDKATIQAMTARLKQHLPELVTIAVSQHRDVLDMVWLINHGQIFRFLRKPLSPGRCAISLQAALKHHRMLLNNPELIKRHEVEDADSTGVVEGMLTRLRQVRRLWASA